MINKISSFLLLILIGYILKSIKFLKEDEGEILKKILFNISLPSLVLYSILTSKFFGNYMIIFILVPVSMIIQFILLFIFGKLYIKDKKDFANLILSGVMGNTAFLGYPLVEIFFGINNLSYGILYDQAHFYTFLLIIYPLISYISGNNIKSIKSSFISPPIFAFLTGLILRNFYIPTLIIESLNILKTSVTPLVMLYIGINLEFSFSIKDLTYLLPVTIFKLIIFPFLFYFISSFFVIQKNILNVSLLQSMMPTMMATIIFGAQVGLNKKTLAKAVGLTTIISPITILLLSKFLIK
ncbi:MAG: AEC family transporter [Caldisericia bacterium]